MRGDVNEAHKWSALNVPVLDASDWEVAVIGGLAGGAGPGATALFFAFRSPSLEQYLRFVFVGGGPAYGAVGSWYDPQAIDTECSRASWRPIGSAIAEPFSASNLCNAPGRVSVISVATPGKLGWGYTKLLLTAVYSGQRRSGYLFDRFSLSGWGLGLGGLGLGVTWGSWIFLGLPRRVNSNWTQPVCTS